MSHGNSGTGAFTWRFSFSKGLGSAGIPVTLVLFFCFFLLPNSHLLGRHGDRLGFAKYLSFCISFKIPTKRLVGGCMGRGKVGDTLDGWGIYEYIVLISRWVFWGGQTDGVDEERKGQEAV